MPNKSKKSTPVPDSKGRAPSSSHSVISNSGRNVPPTTRSMQGRLSSTSHASSPRVQAGSSRSLAQQGTPQRTVTAAANRDDDVENSDDDDDDDDDNEHDSDDNPHDDEEDEEEESNDEDDDSSDDEENSISSRVFDIFAITEPNGLTKSEILSPDVTNRLSLKYRALVKVVAAEAMRNPAFYNSISEQMVVPGDEWSLHMYCRLRTRFDDTILRFDVNNYTVVMTATHLLNLVAAIKSLVKSANWRMMRSRTRLEYFGLVLDILRNTVARDNDRRPARSSPYALETTKDHNLYLQMIASGRCAHTINLLHELFTKLQSPIDHNQADQIRSLLDEIVAKDNRYRKSRVPGVPLASEDSAIRIRRLAAAIFPRQYPA